MFKWKDYLAMVLLFFALATIEKHTGVPLERCMLTIILFVTVRRDLK